MTIRLPKEGERPEDLGDEVWGPRVVMSQHEQPRVVAFDYFSVEVQLETSVSSAALDMNPEAPDGKVLSAEIDAADGTARRTAGRFRRWLLLEQPLLGSPSELPPIVGYASVWNLDSGTRVRTTPTMTMYGYARSEETAIPVEGLADIVQRVRAGEDPPEPETLLAEARTLLLHSEGVRTRPKISVLLGAVAVEVKAKRTWEQLAREEQRALLDLALSNPRAFPRAAIDLFDSVAQALIGRSYRVEDKAGFRELQQLFELRNQVAHRAQTIEESSARTAIRAGEAAFVWLDGVVEQAEPK